MYTTLDQHNTNKPNNVDPTSDHNVASMLLPNVRSTLTRDIGTTLPQHSFNVYLQHWINIISMSKKHWFNNRHQRCSQCRINVISTFTHDTETTLHQHSFNVYMQHWINVISMSKKNIDSMTDINIASMLLLILDQCWINVFLLSGIPRSRKGLGSWNSLIRLTRTWRLLLI